LERKVALAGAREKLSAARGTLQTPRAQRDRAGERAKRLDTSYRTAHASSARPAATLVLHTERHAIVAAARAPKTRSPRRARSSTRRTDLGDREAGLKDLRTRADESKEALAHTKWRSASARFRCNTCSTGVREKFRGLDLGRVIGDSTCVSRPTVKLRDRIQELSGLLDRMGSVNLDAMREHDDAEKRYTFYTTQKADLDKALPTSSAPFNR